MDERRRTRVSKFLSKHLRHSPQEIGLTLSPGGWVSVEELLAACARGGIALTSEELDEVIATSPKQRFSYDENHARVRANQGHSVEVDLQLATAEPPARLYHGTAEPALDAIFREGLRPMQRHHVHLSADAATARTVGARHGSPVVLAVDAVSMRAEGAIFYRSQNGVWLVDHVPPRHLRTI